MNMIRNLFSMFDPSTYYLGAGWTVILLPIALVITKEKKINSKKEKLVIILTEKIGKEIETLNETDEKKSTSFILKTIFFMLITINLIAILPINFTPTAHVSISIVIRLTIWIRTILNALINSTKSIIIHLTPIGTPTALINFMVIIELVRNMIRPITLAVRLTANIVAGHLLITLLSRFSILSKIKILTRSLPIIILVILEIAVAVIQAYVITILICLYYKETF